MSIRGKLISWLFGNREGTFIRCGKCGSAFVEHFDVADVMVGSDRKVAYAVKCKRCGKQGAVVEVW